MVHNAQLIPQLALIDNCIFPFTAVFNSLGHAVAVHSSKATVSYSTHNEYVLLLMCLIIEVEVVQCTEQESGNYNYHDIICISYY